jgi:hypothetical protein
VKIKESGCKNNKNEFQSAPAIEEYTEKQNYNILIFFVCKVIGNQKGRKKIQKENDTAENHFNELRIREKKLFVSIQKRQGFIPAELPYRNHTVGVLLYC